jgi:hypothetical protein
VVIVAHYCVGDANGARFDAVWTDTFPPMGHLAALPGWLLTTHTGGMLGYPLGGPNWGSTLSAICFLAGVVILARQRRWLLLTLLLAPLGLNFVAAAMRRYPYGGHPRLQLFLAPSFCILISLGVAGMAAWLAARRKLPVEGEKGTVPICRNGPEGAAHKWGLSPFPRLSPLAIVLFALVAFAAGSLVRDLAQPYKSGTTLRAREFAQWFWFNLARDCELACFETDFHESLAPAKANCGWSSLYYCNQRIYSPRHARGEALRLEQISADRPLCCAIYRSPQEEHDSPPRDPKVLEHWLARMRSQYVQVGYDKFPQSAYDKADRRVLSFDFIEVYKFVPKATAAAAPSAQAISSCQNASAGPGLK